MSSIYRNPASCGSQILEGLDNVDEDWLRRSLKPIYRNYEQRQDAGHYEEDYAGVSQGISDFIYGGETIVFSDADASGNGTELAKLIAKYNLGELTSISCVNPNTSRPITTWLWRYNGNVLPEKAVKLPAAKVVPPVKAKPITMTQVRAAVRGNR